MRFFGEFPHAQTGQEVSKCFSGSGLGNPDGILTRHHDIETRSLNRGRGMVTEVIQGRPKRFFQIQVAKSHGQRYIL